MKNYRRKCGFRNVIGMLSICMIILAMIGCEKTAQQSDEDSKISLSKEMTDVAYDNYLEDILKEIKTSGGIVWEIKNNLTSKEQSATIHAPKDGTYVLGISYNSAEHKKTDIRVSVKVDEDNIAEKIQLNKIYKDAGDVRIDGQGNEFAAEQIDFGQCVFVYPVKEQTLELYQIALTKGEHQVSVSSENGTLYVSELVFKAEEETER